MSDSTHWIVIAILIVIGIALLIFRISRGAASGRMGVYLIFRIVLIVAVIGFAIWRYLASHH